MGSGSDLYQVIFLKLTFFPEVKFLHVQSFHKLLSWLPFLLTDSTNLIRIDWCYISCQWSPRNYIIVYEYNMHCIDWYDCISCQWSPRNSIIVYVCSQHSLALIPRDLVKPCTLHSEILSGRKWAMIWWTIDWLIDFDTLMHI